MFMYAWKGGQWLAGTHHLSWKWMREGKCGGGEGKRQDMTFTICTQELLRYALNIQWDIGIVISTSGPGVGFWDRQSTFVHTLWSEDCFYYCSERNNVVVLFGTLKVQSLILIEVSDCDLLIVVTPSAFLKRKDMLKEKSS